MTARKVTKKIKPAAVPLPPGPLVLAEKAASAAFPIVGIGASAGGLAAFKAFFSGMPADSDPGMAFVLVQHLSPDHESILTEIIRHHTRMQVFEVVDGMAVRPNCVYIIPPNCDMAFLNGTLQLLEPSAPHGHRLPIDFFFRSLADDQRERAICIVLTGAGSDGTLGVRAIKGEGGMVIAQNPASAEYASMPRSAIATGLVDYELPPAEIPAQLIAYVAHGFGKLPRAAAAPTSKAENALKKIFILLRTQTGRDFSQYKTNTIHRRIERRMVVHQIETLDDYVKYLQQTPSEVEALLGDLLIGVTQFFRDAVAFQALEQQIIPQLLAGKPAGSTLRVWSTGCSTGEEAYSMAILLREQLEDLENLKGSKPGIAVEIFATDIDRQAIATARAGLYPASIAAQVSPERLARFFTADPDGSAYRIHKVIRDMLVFSEHDVIKDPPFSRLDLLSCRNLLIYMGGELQKKLIPLFHFALNPGGFLFLGTSETVGDFDDLFAGLDRKAKLYQRKMELHGAPRAAQSRFLPLMTATDALLPRFAAKTALPVRLPLRELTEQAILQQVAPAAALVSAQGDILYLHGRPGMYLEPAPGEAGVNNILKMAREGLRRALSMALHQAAARNERVRCPGLSVKTNGHFTPVNLSICPLISAAGRTPAPGFTNAFASGFANTADSPLYLVILEEAAPLPPEQAQQTANAGANNRDTADAAARIAALQQELRATEEYLQSTQQELESSNEEIKSSSEEMHSVNEELHTTNEELETTKEELQSVNEELATLNAELQTKVVDLSRTNNDMNNLLAGTGIGTVFVDLKLRILRFTPTASVITNLILSDVGRPVAHIVSNLVRYDRLVADVQAVLDTLQPKEVDVQATNGKWYTMRILPYRTLDNAIEGAVITFVDIDEIVHTREALRKANEVLRLAVVVRDAHDAITVQDLDGRILAWNPGAARMYGWSEAEALLMNVCDRIPQELREAALSKVHQLSLAEILEPYRTQRMTKEGVIVEVWMTATALVNEAGQMYAIATTERTRESIMGRTIEVQDVPEGAR
jgi:two-component system CheB/CheR fusion protein